MPLWNPGGLHDLLASRGLQWSRDSKENIVKILLEQDVNIAEGKLTKQQALAGFVEVSEEMENRIVELRQTLSTSESFIAKNMPFGISKKTVNEILTKRKREWEDDEEDD